MKLKPQSDKNKTEIVTLQGLRWTIYEIELTTSAQRDVMLDLYRENLPIAWHYWYE